MGKAIALLEDYAAGLNAVAAGARLVAQVKSPFAGLATGLPAITGGMEELDRQFEASQRAAAKAKADAEAAAKAYKTWAASVTGLDKAMKAAALERNLARLTAEGKLNATATQAIIREYNELRPSLDQLSEPLERLRTGYQDVLESTRVFGAAQAMVNTRTLPDAVRMFQEGQTAVEQFGVRLKYLESTSIDLVVAMNAIPGVVKSTAVAADLASRTLGQRIGANLAENLEEALGEVPRIITDALIHGTSVEDTAAALGTVIGAAIGAAVGGALGGPAGAKIGEAVGALLGPLLDKIIVTRAEKTQERVRKEFGVAISEGLAQAIEDASRDFAGDRQAAKLFNLDRIIAEGGGLSSQNIDLMLARLREVFSTIDRGAFTTEQAMQVLDKNFAQFAEFVTRDGALASKALLDIIKLNERFGTSSKAVAEFVTKQLTGAIGGLATFLDNAKVTSQAAAEGIAASVFGIFEALTKQGATPLEAIKQLTPILEKLDAQLKAAGFSGGAAFDQIRGLAALASDAVKGPMIEAITGLGQALEGLHNSGVLNQEMFAGLATQITDTYNKLIAQGTDGNKALQLVGPTLQTLWELQADFGYAVDEATQKLLDEAEAAGVVGDQHRSAQEKMALAMDRTADAVEYLAAQFGYVAENASNAADEINKIPKNVNIKVNYRTDLPKTDPYRGPPGLPGTEGTGYGEGVGYAKGGVVYAQRGMWAPRGTDTVPAMLTPGEVVLPRDVVAALRSGPSAPVTVYLTITTLDGADVERVVRSPEFRQALTSAVSGNVGGYRTELRTAIGVR